MSKGGFSRNVAKLAAGNVVAQALAIVTVPIITRLYDPAQFGIFSIFVGIVALLAPISTLQYHAAMVLPKDHHAAWLLRRISMRAVLGLGLLTAAGSGVLVVGQLQGAWNATFVSSHVIWLLVPALVIQGLLLVDTTWLMRSNAFGRAAKARVVEAFVDRVVGIGFGLVHPAAVTLAIGKFVGGLAAWSYARSLVCRGASKGKSDAESGGASSSDVATRYRGFAIYSSVAVLVAAAARELPVILLGLLFGAPIAAFYALGLRVVNMPMMTVGDAVAKVFFQHTATLAGNRQDMAEPALRLLSVLLLLSAPVLVILAIHGTTLFKVVFGGEWEEAGFYVAILAPAYMVLLLARPIAALFDVLEQQKRKLVWTSLNLIGRVVVIFGISFAGAGVVGAVWGITLVTIVSQLGAMVQLLRMIGVTWRRLACRLGRAILLLAPTVVGVPVTKFMMNEGQSLVAAAFLLVVQIATLYIFDHDLREMPRRFMKGRHRGKG